jgi:hypothetical protein
MMRPVTKRFIVASAKWGEIYDLLRPRDRLRLTATIVTEPRCSTETTFMSLSIFQY